MTIFDDPLPDPYRAALARVTETCRKIAAAELGLRLPAIELKFSLVAKGRERIRTDYQSKIFYEFSSVNQFRPPPEGARCIYGTCHEIGHIVVAQGLGATPLPPVTWDEALAHALAARLFVIGVWNEYGSYLWPNEYADYGTSEGLGSLGVGPRGHLGDYEASLRALDSQIGACVNRSGWRTLIQALARLESEDMHVLRFWPALQAAIGSGN